MLYFFPSLLLREKKREENPKRLKKKRGQKTSLEFIIFWRVLKLRQ